MKVVQLNLSARDWASYCDSLLDYVQGLKGMNLNPDCEANLPKNYLNGVQHLQQ
jgi:hypothetical protein